MNIAEMHINFRQYGQKMGIQNVRAILPEQIDALINQSIMDVVNQLIRENIGTANDRVSVDNSKIGQINAFRTLHVVKETYITFTNKYLKTTKVITTIEEEEIINIAEEIVSQADADSDITIDNVRTIITYKELGSTFVYNNQDSGQGLIKHFKPNIGEDTVFGKYMFLIKLSINYTANDIITDWYPVRLIESNHLSDVLNDFISKNRFRSPIGCLYKDDTFELYIDKFKAGTITPQIEIKSSVKTISLVPNKLRIDLLKYPATVKYDDVVSNRIDCDMPESMHGDIVKRAVDLYRISVNGSSQTN